MAVFKCKMCGGALEINEEKTVVECEYCGTTQTVPRADDDKKMSLFARASRLRANNEFDKASSVYESIVAEFSEEAEAYWGLVLCKYGIEYVDDPATGKKIPTCHRSSFESVLDDNNYELTLEYADTLAKRVYREEAKQIEEIRKGIIEVSSKEEPYDIFICYKETAENVDRTIDSVLAQDIYEAVTEKGYRTFFAKITLEDKLGQEYEPYIFAALNSAKIMLVVGTDYEYFDAVWVKNEWSRFIKLMASDKSKHIIPCYKNIDAYDMPKEFAKLQAQDLGKVGAIQDLLRGIEKILPKQKTEVVKEVIRETVVTKNGPDTESLLKRAFMFLEDGDWNSANEYCEKVLDINPECAEAYLGKMLVDLRLRRETQLGEMEKTFENSKFYDKVVRFADLDLKSRLNKQLERIKTRIEQRRLLLSAKRNEIKPAIGLISAGSFHSLGVKSNGTVVAVGSNYYGACNVGNWQNIIAVAGTSSLGLKADGTVISVGENRNGECNVEGWQDIVDFSQDEHTLGVLSNGTVVSVGYNADGQCNISGWKNIVAVAAGQDHSLGLKNDGTVLAVGNDDSDQCDVDDWNDIVSISAGVSHSLGLRADGTVLAAGDNSKGQCNVAIWKNIVAISAGSEHSLGLKVDGTVVAAGDNDDGQCDVGKWNNVVAISAGNIHSLGLRSDGTVVAVGDNSEGQCNVKKWRLFDDYINFCHGRETAIAAFEANEEVLKKEQFQKQLELRLIEEQERQRQAEVQKQQAERRAQGVCQYCGGKFKGLFTKKCEACGRNKDY